MVFEELSHAALRVVEGEINKSDLRMRHGWETGAEPDFASLVFIVPVIPKESLEAFVRLVFSIVPVIPVDPSDSLSAGCLDRSAVPGYLSTGLFGCLPCN